MSTLVRGAEEPVVQAVGLSREELQREYRLVEVGQLVLCGMVLCLAVSAAAGNWFSYTACTPAILSRPSVCTTTLYTLSGGDSTGSTRAGCAFLSLGFLCAVIVRVNFVAGFACPSSTPPF